MTADVKLAIRQLRKSPGFAITAVLTLAMGIGANAIVFSVLNALMLRPLKVPQPQSLYMVERYFGSEPSPSNSYPDYVDLRDRNHTFEDLAAYHIMGTAGLDTGNSPSEVWPYLVSANYFDALQVQPYLGRFLHGNDDKGPNSAPYMVLSYAYWHSHFGADPSAVGRTVQINKHPFTIVGVAQPDFRGSELFFVPDVFLPLADIQEIEGWDALHDRGDHFAWLVGHLRSGVTPAQATADLNAVAANLTKSYPKEDDGLKVTLARPGLVGDYLGKPAREFMVGIMLLAGMILLAACANLGSLFGARAADRSREIAVRMALGSRRGLILRQLLTEAVLVSLVGGALGMFGGVAILRWLSAWQPIPNIPINVPVNPDASVYLLALLLALASGLLFGVVPVRQVMRSDPWQIIRSGGTMMGNARRFSLRDVLLAFQIAICAVLVTSSLVAVRGLARSLHSDIGFQPQQAMLVNADLQMAGYTREQQPLMEQKMLDATRAISGVTAVGYTNGVPLGLDGGSDSGVYKDNVSDYRQINNTTEAQEFNVSPDYFKAAGTTFIAGRTFTLHDDSKAPMVAVVNREFAREVFGSVERAIGSYYKVWNGTRVQVVGVVEDGKYVTLTEKPTTATFYSFLQRPSNDVFLVVRSQRDPQEIAGALQRTLRGLDPALPLDIQTWNQEMTSALFAARVATVALGVLGLLGAMLAITGIFGMASYVVSKRMREIGIRVALGADQKKVLAAALGRAFRLLTIGSVAGMILGVLATNVLSYIVYQATPRDPLVLGGVVLTMMVLGLIAAWIPAQRALSVDPMILLRDE
jgi:predicted permease